MKKRLKLNIFSIAAVLCGITLLFAVSSCKKQDEVYRKYVENGEIVYLGKTDSLLAYSGFERAKLLWLPPKDAKVKHVKVFWNNWADSMIVPLERLSEGRFQEVIIDGLTEGVHTFVLYTIGDHGYTSVRSELNVPVYGENYQTSLLNRFPQFVSYHGEDLEITFNPAEATVISTEVTYKDYSGNLHTKSIPASENMITIADFNPNQPVRYRTEHVPDSNAIDSFFSVYENLEIPYYIGRSPIFLTGFMRDAIDDSNNDVNYEYIQLMAATDINFAETPFSLVVCRNPNNWTPEPNQGPSNGWAVGGQRSYKFDLTQGTVSKGEFFYIGGTSKLINGQNSTDIASAKWIRTKNHGTEVGDGGLGDVTPTTGLLPNFGNPAGIAVFMGTEVTSNSIPIDALFFGNPTSTTLSRLFTGTGASGRGYRVPDSDLYQTIGADGALQPFFAQMMEDGTRVNTYCIPELATADREKGNFIKMGGVFDPESRTWTTPRNWSYLFLTKTSTLSDIETGSGVTVMAN
ncbi:MAG TPA: DUF4998 domain-containing protein [Sphingobacterium sp.]|nr:DUF4998 domain-containing protein [Sphingobacterium sp.]